MLKLNWLQSFSPKLFHGFFLSFQLQTEGELCVQQNYAYIIHMTSWKSRDQSFDFDIWILQIAFGIWQSIGDQKSFSLAY